MPTPSGMPKKGDRVRQHALDGKTWRPDPDNYREGTVMERLGGGLDYAIRVKWDGLPMAPGAVGWPLVLEVPYHLKMGTLVIVG